MTRAHGGVVLQQAAELVWPNQVAQETGPAGDGVVNHQEAALGPVGRDLGVGQDLQVTGSLRFTCTEVLLNGYLAPHVWRFLELHPGIDLSVICTDSQLSLSRREADLAIDFCEDVRPIPMEDVNEIVRCFTRAGAKAKISSIHVNGWFGDYDKLATTRLLFEDVFRSDLDRIKDQVIFSGDSPNDAPMFEFFPNSVGVANVTRFKDKMDCQPSWVTENEGGYGFAEMVDMLLS